MGQKNELDEKNVGQTLFLLNLDPSELEMTFLEQRRRMISLWN